ncbi:5711_t:CDS:2 [Funneliformis geosporum]|nr:5711_t:CDS:2 [Funneliformis geosporum]
MPQKISIKERLPTKDTVLVVIPVKKNKNLKQRCHPGRPKVLSPKKWCYLSQLARSRAGATSFEIADTLNNSYPGLNIATRTVRKNL